MYFTPDTLKLIHFIWSFFFPSFSFEFMIGLFQMMTNTFGTFSSAFIMIINVSFYSFAAKTKKKMPNGQFIRPKHQKLCSFLTLLNNTQNGNYRTKEVETCKKIRLLFRILRAFVCVCVCDREVPWVPIGCQPTFQIPTICRCERLKRKWLFLFMDEIENETTETHLSYRS